MLDELNASLDLIILQTKANANILMTIFAVLWGMYLLSRLYRGFLYLGIIPRHLRGLTGILFAPLLHADFNHLFFNTIPLLVLANFLLINGTLYFIHITLYLTIFSGLCIWLFGKPGLHIGASSIITGYWAVCVMGIYQQATLTAILLGALSIYYFIGILYAIFPSGEKGVSWEGHLFGLLGGISASFLIIPTS